MRANRHLVYVSNHVYVAIKEAAKDGRSGLSIDLEEDMTVALVDTHALMDALSAAGFFVSLRGFVITIKWVQ